MGLPTVDDALTRGLIGVVQGVSFQTADEDPLSDLFSNDGEEGVQDTDAEVVDAADSQPSWSTADPYGYNLVRQYVIDTYFGGETQGMAGLINSFVKDWAWELAEKGTKTNQDGTTRDVALKWPTPQEIVANAEFLQGAAWLPHATTIAEIIPPGTDKVFSDPETGQFWNVTYDPNRGLVFEEPELEDLPGPPLGDLGRTATEEIMRTSEEERAARVSRVPPSVMASLDPEAQIAIGGTASFTGPGGRTNTMTAPIVPPITVITDAIKPKTPSSGRRGTGRAAEPKIDWDRRKLTQMAEEAYRSWLLEDSSDRYVKSIVDGYISEATGFWKQSGGKILDYGAYVKEKLRETQRYKTIFKHKPEDIEEDEFIGSYASPIASMGLRPETGRRQIEQSVTSGGSVTGQVTRISRTREGADATGFGQRFARKVSELGAGVRI